MTILNHNKDLINYISSLNLNLSIPQRKHLFNFLSPIINSEGKKNVSSINRNMVVNTNRSNSSRFLTESPWDETIVNSSRLENTSNYLVSEAKRTGENIFISIDDTLITKSKDSKHIENMSVLHSHVTGSYEWAHCEVAMHGKCGDLSIPLNLKPYISKKIATEQSTDFYSKNELAAQLLTDLSFTKENQTYLLMDKWFSSSNLIMSALKLGIHSIIPLKSNRRIYPEGISMNISKYSELLEKKHFDLVTVKGKDYYTFRYEGHLKGIPNTVILFSYEVDGDNLKAPMFILSTDISLSDSDIISFYLKRWDIETAFRYQKENLGLDQYQMRKFKGIKRFWYLIYLAHNYLALKLFKESEFQNLGDVIRSEKKNTLEGTIRCICSLSKSGISEEEIVLKFLKQSRNRVA